MKNWVIVAVLVLLGFAAWYFFTAGQPVEPDVVVEAPVPVRAAPQSEASAPVIETTDPELALQPEPGIEAVTQPPVDAVPMPMLEDSDPLVLDSLGGLIGKPAVSRYVVNDNVISRMVATIDTLGSRQVPGVVQVVEGPAEQFHGGAE